MSNEVKIAIQINGKTRDVMTAKKDIEEESMRKIVEKESKALKFIENNGYFRTYNQCCMRWCYSMDKSVFNPIKEELFFEYMVNLVKNLSYTKAQFNFLMTNIL